MGWFYEQGLLRWPAKHAPLAMRTTLEWCARAPLVCTTLRCSRARVVRCVASRG